ncbi:electron transfer flavoprotein beta subunit [Weissella oryzae SG25]|uniref:Electron transfer flavoprotein small subunit n=1 Tax=Weissella oryzae (strain DSM 25784 / JCM 18191 / LMG 30913 / SG25) TaxID=1329250 RepID=A0A069CTP2_WEIOS|nr:electron transfer flavoprotein subunit beta/FixA family protein [Weissella oryzae]GAK30834.1 electron transfer flavoprotein beta subunit [Weissella oryzae SG25]
MKIVVAVKQVPNTDNVAIDPITHNLVRSNDNKMNKYDKHALETAFEIAAKNDDEVVAISMGPNQAKEVLAEAIAMGASKGILLSDRKFAGADTLATAYVLAKAIAKLTDVRLVIFGQQAIDADTGQVGPLVATQLAWPQLTYLYEIMAVDAEEITAKRNLGPVSQTITANYPAVLTISDLANEPRYLSAHRLMTMADDAIITWNAEKLAAEDERIGLAGSPSAVRAIVEPKEAGRQGKVIEAASAVEQVLAILKSEGMIR